MSFRLPPPIRRTVRLPSTWPSLARATSLQGTPTLTLQILAFLVIVGSNRCLLGQVPQLRTGTASPILGGVGSAGSPPVDIPQTNLTPIAPPAPFSPTAPPTQLADPYAAPGAGVTAIAPPLPGTGMFGGINSNAASAPLAPNYPTAPPGTPIPQGAPTGNVGGFPPSFGQPTMAAPTFGPSTFGQPGLDTVYGPAATGAPAYPSTIYPSGTPSTLYPNGVFAESTIWPAVVAAPQKAFRLFQGPRFQYTFINSGDKLSDVEVNDFDTSAVFAFPRIMNSTQPFYVIPSFSLHLWSGPNSEIGADLPSRAYSAFMDFGWQSDPLRMVSTEFGLRLGAFTDFDTYNSRSFRVLGNALVHFRLSPSSTLRGGVYYVNRNDIKILPAFGILCQPNPYTNVDLFFPRPKFSRYCQTIGTQDLWWYIGGDYGGGTWTIKRENGTEDSIDMNELRVAFGLEWGETNALRIGRRTAFFEMGVAFDRKIEYYVNPQDNFDTRESFFLSLGFGY